MITYKQINTKCIPSLFLCMLFIIFSPSLFAQQAPPTVVDNLQCSAQQISDCGTNTNCLYLSDGTNVCSCKSGFVCDGINPVGLALKSDGSSIEICLGNTNCVSSITTIVEGGFCNAQELSQCGTNSDCLKLSDGSFTCSCKSGFVCDGANPIGLAVKSDGSSIQICLGTTNCVPSETTIVEGGFCNAQELSQCGTNSDCLKLSDGSFTCSCKSGFVCDGANPIGLALKSDGSSIQICLGTANCVSQNTSSAPSSINSGTKPVVTPVCSGKCKGPITNPVTPVCIGKCGFGGAISPRGFQ